MILNLTHYFEAKLMSMYVMNDRLNAFIVLLTLFLSNLLENIVELILIQN